MYLQKLRLGSSLYRPSLSYCIMSRAARGLWGGLLIMLLAHGLGWPLPTYANNPLVTLEIRYHMPDAGEVLFIWGINGWTVVPEEIRLAGTVVKNGKMETLMVREGDTFSVKVQVPAGAKIDYGFVIVETRDGTKVDFWEGGRESITATQNGLVKVQTRLTFIQGQATRIVDNAPLVTQEFPYQMAEADEVFLVWGIDGWILVPEAIRPPRTMVKDSKMYTPMIRKADTFSTRVQIPSGENIGYLGQ